MKGRLGLLFLFFISLYLLIVFTFSLSPLVHIGYFIISQVPVFVSYESKQLIFLDSTNNLTSGHP